MASDDELPSDIPAQPCGTGRLRTTILRAGFTPGSALRQVLLPKNSSQSGVGLHSVRQTVRVVHGAIRSVTNTPQRNPTYSCNRGEMHRAHPSHLPGDTKSVQAQVLTSFVFTNEHSRRSAVKRKSVVLIALVVVLALGAIAPGQA